MKYGLQMYSMRDVTPKDMEGALRDCAEMGYGMVEFAGFFGHDADRIRQWLDRYGLTCSGTHSGADGLLAENLEASIAYHKTIGCENYIVPGADLSTRENLDRFIDLVNAAQPILHRAGIQLHYHNHSHEFYPNKDGLMIHEELQKRTSLFFELDTFWVFNAGVDPIALMEKLKDRVRVIHLKDGLVGGEGRSLGMGEAPVKQIRAFAIEHGFDMVVESEGLSPSGPEEVKRCIDFLKACDLAEGI